MIADVNLQPIHNLIAQHPVMAVITVAFCIAVIIGGIIACYSIIKAK
jgi:hypothetical protein